MKYKSPDEIVKKFPSSSTGNPLLFTVIDGSLQIAPIPDQAYTFELTYRQQLPALSSINTTNWLLQEYPDIYLYASLLAAQAYIIDDGRITILHSLYEEAVDGANDVDWYTGTTMAVSAG